jgi:hypothetical protein
LRSLLAVVFVAAGCGDAPTPSPTSGASTGATSAAPRVSASAPASGSVVFAPPPSDRPAAERERELQRLFTGDAVPSAFALVETDPGEPFDLRLRGALRSDAKIELGAITTSGKVEEQGLRDAVLRRFVKIRGCYADGLVDNPNLSGRVAIRVVGRSEGPPENVEDGGSDLPDTGTRDCIIEAFRHMRFPSPTAGTFTSTIPLILIPR